MVPFVDFLDASIFTIQHRPKNANADVLSRLPFPSIAEDPQPRYRLTDLSDLDVYFVGASGIHSSSLQTSSDSSLGGLADALGELANALSGRCFFFVGGAGSSAFLENSARFGAIRQYAETTECMSTTGSVLVVRCRSLFESAQLLGRDWRRAL